MNYSIIGGLIFLIFLLCGYILKLKRDLRSKPEKSSPGPILLETLGLLDRLKDTFRACVDGKEKEIRTFSCAVRKFVVYDEDLDKAIVLKGDIVSVKNEDGELIVFLPILPESHEVLLGKVRVKDENKNIRAALRERYLAK